MYELGAYCLDMNELHQCVNFPGKIIFATLKATFRYGREEDEMMGVAMSKEINVDKTIVYGAGKKTDVEKDQLQVCGYH